MTYQIESDGAITCLICHRTSHNPNDAAQRYCGACRLFHDNLAEECRAVRDAIAPEVMAGWLAEIKGGYAGGHGFKEDMADVWCSGQWLHAELRLLGCGKNLADSICAATGQRQAMTIAGGDIWSLAVIALERYKRGDWDTPGRKLADRLCAQVFQNPLLAREWLNAFIKKAKT